MAIALALLLGLTAAGILLWQLTVKVDWSELVDYWLAVDGPPPETPAERREPWNRGNSGT